MNLWILAIYLLLCGQAFTQPIDRYAVLITEVMADPSPPVGLPPVEYLELKNISKQPILLDRWRLSDASGTAVLTGAPTLLPDSQLIVCAKSQAAALQPYGKTFGLSAFPSLDNDGETLVLSAPDGKTIHAVAYQHAWYRNPVKSEGGWSLEMINPQLPCAGSQNWTASHSPSGGTPGQPNSPLLPPSDTQAPHALHAYSTDSSTLMLCFDETLDSTAAAYTLAYRTLDGLPAIHTARPVPPLFDMVSLQLLGTMQEGVVYRIEVHGLRDCPGNRMPVAQILQTGRSGPIRSGQLRINEVLFNPRPEGSDHVELLNLGPGIIDAATLYLANRTGNGPPANLRKCSPTPRAILPGDHPTFTQDSAATRRQYPVARPAMLFQMATLPSYPDEAGTVVVLDAQGRECDAFAYRSDDHFPLLAQREGVALERIDPRKPTQTRDNWHSAATDAGYATPTARNSQYLYSDTLAGSLSLSQTVISPDMDGIHDALQVRYRFAENGWTCSAIITDGAGRPVRHLARNALCGTEGAFGWDGLDDRQQRLPPGQYYLVFEAVSTQGKRRVWRKGVVIAYRR